MLLKVSYSIANANASSQNIFRTKANDFCNIGVNKYLHLEHTHFMVNDPYKTYIEKNYQN